MVPSAAEATSFGDVDLHQPTVMDGELDGAEFDAVKRLDYGTQRICKTMVFEITAFGCWCFGHGLAF